LICRERFLVRTNYGRPKVKTREEVTKVKICVLFLSIVLVLLLLSGCEKSITGTQNDVEQSLLIAQNSVDRERPDSVDAKRLYEALYNWALKAPDGGQLAACIKKCWHNVYLPCCNRMGSDPDNPDWEDICLSLFLTCFANCYNYAKQHSLAVPQSNDPWDILRARDSCPDCRQPDL